MQRHKGAKNGFPLLRQACRQRLNNPAIRLKANLRYRIKNVELRRQEAEGRRQKTEGRRQKAEGTEAEGAEAQRHRGTKAQRMDSRSFGYFD
ncbi:MAG: hypothetical protein NTX52_02805 [Planctomycetota bacterium]|nr:hypothetical protein [Planctomycetota bacterium]